MLPLQPKKDDANLFTAPKSPYSWMPGKNHAPRKFIRFKIRDCVLVDFKSADFNLGEVLDISLDGLGLRFVDCGETIPSAGKLRFFVSSQTFTISEIPFKTVWSQQSVHHMPSGSMCTWRCGVQFGPLEEVHRSALRRLIMTHSTDDPES